MATTSLKSLRAPKKPTAHGNGAAPPPQELSLPGGEQLTNSYANLGVSRGWSPMPAQRLKMWITSFAGQGKSSFLSSNPRAIIIDTDDSMRLMAHSRAAYVSHNDLPRILQLVDQLESDGKRGVRQYDHFCIDTLDKFRDIVVAYLSKQAGHDILVPHANYDPRNAYDRVRSFIMSLLNRLYEAGYGWTVTGHTVRRVDAAGNEYVKAANWDSLIASVYGETQVMAHIIRDVTTEKVPTGKTIKQGKQEVAQTVDKEVYTYWLTLDSRIRQDTKTRYIEQLPKFLDITGRNGWQRWTEAWDAAGTAYAAQLDTPAENLVAESEPSPA